MKKTMRKMIENEDDNVDEEDVDNDGGGTVVGKCQLQQ